MPTLASKSTYLNRVVETPAPKENFPKENNAPRSISRPRQE